MTRTSKQFTQLLVDLGFFINLDYTSKAIIPYYFDEDSKPISIAQIEQRFHQYCVNKGLPKQAFFLGSLPTYKFKRGVPCN